MDKVQGELAAAKAALATAIAEARELENKVCNSHHKNSIACLLTMFDTCLVAVRPAGLGANVCTLRTCYKVPSTPSQHPVKSVER